MCRGKVSWETPTEHSVVALLITTHLLTTLAVLLSLIESNVVNFYKWNFYILNILTFVGYIELRKLVDIIDIWNSFDREIFISNLYNELK